MSRFTVVIADDRYASYREEESVLGEVDARIEIFRSGSAAEARKAFAAADGILVNLFPITAEVIGSLDGCRVISRYGVGYDNVDVEAATRRGIWVAFVPDYCFEDVSDHALALLLGCARSIPYKDRKVREGKWNLHRDSPCNRIQGTTLGMVGYGAAAQCMHRKVMGLGFARVLVYDPYERISAIKAAGGTPVDFATLLRESDFVSLHVPLTKETRHMIGAEQIAMMKKSAMLINTSRGPVIDETAVGRALQEGRLAAAGLDVFEKEPVPPDSVLLTLDNVILTDHAGWYSEESEVELKTKAARNVAAVLAGGRPPYPVNRL